MKSINPATNQVIKEYKEHSDSEVAQIINSVNSEFAQWRETSFAERSKMMCNAANILRNNSEQYARTMTLEMGKIISESRAEVEKCAWVCEYYADNAERFLADEIILSDASKSYVAFEPLGLVLAVMPWNFPFWQVFRFAAPALMAGNTGVLKHASNVPGCAMAIEDIFRQAGFPENLFRTLMISSDQVEKVIKNIHIIAITLTGSEPAGMHVASIAGRELKKTVLELGGSDPYIVLDDADLSKCIEAAVRARMINNGQSCISAKRFIVVKKVLKEFEEQKTRIMSSLKLGDPLDETTQVGPLARPDLLDELDIQVKKSIKMGAKLLCGGRRVEGKGSFYLPTVLTNVRKGMPVYEQETFGPVSAIIPVENAKDAIAVANDSSFGLGGSVWTNDIKKGEEMARRIQSGAIFVNGMTKSDPRLPFGGIKRSGYGRELSHYGIKEFVNIKTIWIA